MIILFCLIIITGSLYVAGNSENKLSFDKQLFTLGENMVITSVLLNRKEGQVQLEYVGGLWEVNGKFPIDESMRDVFFAVLSTIEVRRPVAANQKDSIANYLRNQGTQVNITNNGVEVMSYIVGGDKDQYLTYFMDPTLAEPYLMQIPGYLSFIAGIFDVSENDWRERYIWPMDWSRLKSFSVTYTNAEPLLFEYGTNFIHVSGVDQMDTAAVMDFLQYSANLQAITFLGNDTSYNHLISEPYAAFKVEEIANRSYTLDVHDIPGSQQVLGILNGVEKALFPRKNVEYMLKQKEDFQSKE
jgi:hypothetical protein